jgi:alpha-tubulin suppressor-like RCC1 family protein
MRSRFFLTLAAAAVTVIVGCGEDAVSPTGPAAPPAPASAVTAVAFRQVDAGCGATKDNRAYCWGGESGAYVPGGLSFRSVSVGYGFSCAVTTDDALYCWGTNYLGELGDGTNTYRELPTRVASTRRFRSVSAGVHHACAVTVDDLVYCWGYNAFGQLGDGSHTTRLVPVKVVGPRRYKWVSTGYLHSCAVTLDGAGFCWGMNGYWQLGNNAPTQKDRAWPAAIVGGLTFRDVRAGYFHTCGVTTDYKAYCWGNNKAELGSIPPNDDDFQRTPRLVAGGHAFRQVDGDYYHTCGVTTANVAYCWGRNADGEVGDGTTIERWKPVRVIGGLRFRQVAAGGHVSCGVTTDDRAYCWGGTPTPVPPPQ